MLSTKSFLFLATILYFCDAAFVDNLSKCKISDGVCASKLFQSVIHDIAKPGIPELGIPPIDPIKLNNISVTALDGIHMTLIQGQLKGIRDCVIDKFETYIETKRAFIELRCDLSIKGQYKVSSSSSMIKTVLGGDIHGEGNIKVKIEQLYFRVDLNFFLEKRNGEIYFDSKPKDIKYISDVKGSMNFYIDNLFLGKQDASQTVTNLFNQNWKTLMSSFGKPFFDKGLEFLTKFLHKFYDVVPTRYFIEEDLSTYL